MNDSGSHAPEEVSVPPAVAARSGSDHGGPREGRVVWQALPHHRPCVRVGRSTRTLLCPPIYTFCIDFTLKRNQEAESGQTLRLRSNRMHPLEILHSHW